MISYWSALYIIPLAIIFGISIGRKNKDYIIITTVSMVAYIFTRVISEKVTGDRYLYDLANDFMVMASLICFFGVKRPIVIFLMTTYTCMVYFGYIPYSEDTITKNENFIVLELIGKIQLIIITIGIYYHGLRSYCNGLTQSNQFIRSLIQPCIQIYSMGSIFCNRLTYNCFGLGNKIIPEDMGSNFDVVGKDTKVKQTPTYGTSAKDFWKPIK